MSDHSRLVPSSRDIDEEYQAMLREREAARKRPRETYGRQQVAPHPWREMGEWSRDLPNRPFTRRPRQGPSLRTDYLSSGVEGSISPVTTTMTGLSLTMTARPSSSIYSLLNTTSSPPSSGIGATAGPSRSRKRSSSPGNSDYVGKWKGRRY